MSELKEINSNEINDFLKANKLVLVDFWAPWCGPCKMQTPILESLIKSGLAVTIAKLNTDDNTSYAHQMNISSIPTLILFQNGEEIERFIGVQPENVLKSKIEQYL